MSFHMATSTEGKADTSAACHCVFTDGERAIMKFPTDHETVGKRGEESSSRNDDGAK